MQIRQGPVQHGIIGQLIILKQSSKTANQTSVLGSMLTCTATVTTQPRGPQWQYALATRSSITCTPAAARRYLLQAAAGDAQITHIAPQGADFTPQP